MEERIYTVSEISQEVKRVIEQFISPVWIEGEVSNYSVSRVGHVYFSLKDQFSLINCVIWKNIAFSIPYQITTGMHLLVHGNITTYSAQSQYQINVIEVRAAGLGSLYMAFEALKEKLSSEGLFDDSRKVSIPKYPRSIGVVTSPTGAAVRDILQISERRNPSVKIVIFPAQVQGKSAADTIVKGIEVFNKLVNVDFIIIGRGGGSIEDLWAFNEEKVVRAVAASKLPIVSAVGHEVDFALSDFASDLRAPTPSAAAEMTIPGIEEIKNGINRINQSLQQVILLKMEKFRNQVDNIKRRLFLNRPLEIIKQRFQRIDEFEGRLITSIKQALQSKKLRLETIVNTFKALDPKAILSRGFAIVYR
ncbi:MAG: exodeoxyribonuclease VII large subunit, partial [Candidatus Marinimicrobia bacterium]|nr:exodeoxyribonuclease VII large subunit [Candidatus Neomarinimicrobiota bacterium]